MAARCVKSVAKLDVGQSVEIAYNPPTPDSRVPLQANGQFRGRGDYQTAPDKGVVLEVRDTDGGPFYLVEVELTVTHDVGGRKRVVKSHRKRVVHESKLTAV